MKKCDFNCDDCRREICVEGGQDLKAYVPDPGDIDELDFWMNYWFSKSNNLED